MIECHDKGEVAQALSIEDAIIGVNNRDLATLRVDTARAREMLKTVPAERIVVAESGYHDASEVRALRGHADAALIGTRLMRSRDPSVFLREVLQ